MPKFWEKKSKASIGIFLSDKLIKMKIIMNGMLMNGMMSNKMNILLGKH